MKPLRTRTRSALGGAGTALLFDFGTPPERQAAQAPSEHVGYDFQSAETVDYEVHDNLLTTHFEYTPNPTGHAA